MANSITLGEQLDGILTEYNAELKEAVEESAKAGAKVSQGYLKQNAPRRTGNYRKGFRTKKNGEGSYTVYNATAPQLSHLLENGHEIVNKKGKFGRVNGIKHWEPAEELGIKTFNSELKKRLEK